MTELGIALAVFAMGCAVDVAFVWWSRCTQRLDFWGVVAAAALIQIFGLGGLLIVVSDPTLLIANVAGHAVGSGIGITMASRAKEKNHD